MSHPHRTLSRIGATHIEHCNHCEVLHVSIGPATLRLELGAARQLRAALGEALDRLEAATALDPSSSALRN